MDHTDSVPDWNDMSMYNSHFEEGIPADSPFGSSAFHDFTNLDAYNDNSLNLSLRAPSKPLSDSTTSAATVQTAAQGAPLMHTTSAESSSQDSSSDSSSRRKRKTASESPAPHPMRKPDALTKRNVGAMPPRGGEDANMTMSDMHPVRSYDQTFAQPMYNLPLEQTISNASQVSQFDFHSSASSPIQAGDFNAAMSLDSQVRMPAPAMMAHFQDAQVQTINPGMFALADSRDQSPATTNHRSNSNAFQASPTAIFSTSSSDSPETYGNNMTWNQPLLSRHAAWPSNTDLVGQQYSTTGNIAYTPSPTSGNTPSASVGQAPATGASRSTTRPSAQPPGQSPLHIAPISAKSRVETQINVNMTLETPPAGIERLHLPLHTIAKSKLLAKEEHDLSKALELHTMLVCTSAMHNPQAKEKALRRAAAQNNAEIQRRAEVARTLSSEELEEANKNIDEADKPANGGEVRICSNCIQRERKRAGRKKTKREEEQQHWERFETERVVVFNSNEYLSFKPYEPDQMISHEPGLFPEADPYTPPEGALQVTAAMRIACYCRHQNEKEGFQVIFTLKDYRGNVVAQQVSDSILITDDHKTHPPGFTTPQAGDVVYHQNGTFLPNGLPVSHSMVDMTVHAQPFTSSRSTGNLQALGYSQQYNPHSHVHQYSGSGYPSQMNSATMTPTSLSRPASPSSAGQSGPNKKRKSASFHRKVPSGLTMTPRVDTSQPPSHSIPSASSMPSNSANFSPSNTVFSNTTNHSYMTIPNHGGPAQYFGSGPPTPNETANFNFAAPMVDNARFAANQAYFSHPSSAVPSRASSPVLQTRANMAAYARQPPPPTQQHSPNASSSMNARASVYQNQLPPQQQAALANEPAPSGHFPIISRVTPSEGPVSGGTEVAILGENFVMGIQIMFGEHTIPTHFLSPTSLLIHTPPGRVGIVQLTLVPPPGAAPYPFVQNKPTFKYAGSSEDMMVMALKFLSEQQQGNFDAWQSFAHQNAQSYMQTRLGRSGMPQGYAGNQRVASEMEMVEDLALNVFDAADMSSVSKPDYDFAGCNGATMLGLACALGMHRVASALLARGANADVRDNAGFTPLMHAALHGRTHLFRLLLARGADPTTRSLTGVSAIELAPTDLRDELFETVVCTRRRRHSGPSKIGRLSFGSSAASTVSWDIASASYYESEVGSASYESETSGSRDHSRRPSTHESLSDEPLAPLHSALFLDSRAGLLAWRNALAAQIHAFQTSIQHNVVNFQLPPLPQLPHCRRFRSLMPRKGDNQTRPTVAPNSKPSVRTPEQSLSMRGAPTVLNDEPTRQQKFWDVLPSLHLDLPTPSSSPPPPAYNEIFPDRKGFDVANLAGELKSAKSPSSSGQHEALAASVNEKLQRGMRNVIADEKAAVRSASSNTVADSRCVVMTNHHHSDHSLSACFDMEPGKADATSYDAEKVWMMVDYLSTHFVSTIVIPALVILTSIVMHLLMPLIPSMSAGRLDETLAWSGVPTALEVL